jgi:hypothetical protein
MAKDPEDRFQTAGQFAAAVRDALLTGAYPPGTEPRGGEWGVIPASAWVSATEAWQNAAQPPEPEVKPAPAPGSPTQTVIVSNFGPPPPENPSAATSPAVVPARTPPPTPTTERQTTRPASLPGAARLG